MNNKRNNLENILYRIVEEVSKENAPIVFKGGLAINDILSHENSNNNIERKTVDIDANWTGNVDHNQITKTFEKAIKRVNPNYKIELYRLPDKGKSMGYKILDNNIVITKIDLDIKNNPFYVIYRINDIDVKYSSKEKIMADKLSALSNEHPFRRAKDLGVINQNRYVALNCYMSQLGYRKNEPNSIMKEYPSLFKEIIQSYQEDDNYTFDEIAQKACLSKDVLLDISNYNLGRLTLISN